MNEMYNRIKEALTDDFEQYKVREGYTRVYPDSKNTTNGEFLLKLFEMNSEREKRISIELIGMEKFDFSLEALDFFSEARGEEREKVKERCINNFINLLKSEGVKSEKELMRFCFNKTKFLEEDSCLFGAYDMMKHDLPDGMSFEDFKYQVDMARP